MQKGDLFSAEWQGHECYNGRIYKVKSVTRGCTCPDPNNFVNNKPDVPRRKHMHIVATLENSSDESNNYFNGIDEDTLVDIEDPTYRLIKQFSKNKTMSEFKEIDILKLVPSKTNPRSEFDNESLRELSQSIIEHGVLQPIIVRPHPEAKKKEGIYEIVAGERRYRASVLGGVPTIPASVRELTDDEVFEIQIIENLERKDVHPMDEAIAFRKMLDSGKYSMEDIAAKVAKTVTFVAQRLKLNDLIPELKEDFLKGEYGVGSAILLSRINPERQQQFFETLGTYYNPGYSSEKDLRKYLEEKSDDLDEAIFPLGDSKLLPEAGSCLGCPKRSLANPILFPELEENLCMDSVCFAKKDQAFRVNIIKEIMEENPSTVFVKGWYFKNDEILKFLEDNGVTVLNEHEDYNTYGSAKTDAFELKKFEWIKINLKGKNKSKSSKNDDSDLSEELSNAKARAARALELDREKIYLRALTEIKEDKTKNAKMLNSNPLIEQEKKALALSLLSYSDDEWIKKDYKVSLGYNDRHQQLEKIWSDDFYNKLIRHHIQRTLITQNIADFEKSDKPFYMHSIFKHYFPKEIELFTLEQNDIAAKRIEKSDARIKDLESKIAESK